MPCLREAHKVQSRAAAKPPARAQAAPKKTAPSRVATALRNDLALQRQALAARHRRLQAVVHGTTLDAPLASEEFAPAAKQAWAVPMEVEPLGYVERFLDGDMLRHFRGADAAPRESTEAATTQAVPAPAAASVEAPASQRAAAWVSCPLPPPPPPLPRRSYAGWVGVYD